MGRHTNVCPQCRGYDDDCDLCLGEHVVCGECGRGDCLIEDPSQCRGAELRERDEHEQAEYEFLRESRGWRALKERCDEARFFYEAGRASRDEEVTALERELERWRHGQPIEGDYVCPYELAFIELRRLVGCMRREARAKDGSGHTVLGGGMLLHFADEIERALDGGER